MLGLSAAALAYFTSAGASSAADTHSTSTPVTFVNETILTADGGVSVSGTVSRVATTAARARLSSAAPAAATRLPLEGAFESCPLQTMLPTCTQRLAVMHRGGLQVVVMSIIGVSPAEAASYAAAARSLRMSVMWDIATPDWWQQALTSDAAAAAFPQFAGDCGCWDNAELLAYMAEQLGRLGGYLRLLRRG